MLKVTMTARKNDKMKINLPYHAEDILKPHFGSYLGYGKATVKFDTEREGLWSQIKQALPEKLEGGIKELNLLAHILDNMNGQQLGRLEESLKGEDCDFAEVTRRALYFGYEAFDKNGEPNPKAVPLEKYDATWSRFRLEGRIKIAFEKELEAARLTGGQLFEKAIEQARAEGELARFGVIEEYILPETMEKGKLCRYEFDIMPVINYGGSEGIYVDCYLKGKFDESSKNSLRIGVMKTLSTDLDASKAMGEACGTLLHFGTEYVNHNLNRFASTEEINQMLTRDLKMEVPQQEQQGMGMQQM